MQIKSIAEFRISLSYNLSLRSLFCLILSGRFTQVLPYYIRMIFPGLNLVLRRYVHPNFEATGGISNETSFKL